MKYFIPHYSNQTFADGCYFISATTPNQVFDDVVHSSQRFEFSQKAFLDRSKYILENVLQLPRSSQPERTLATVELYETPEGNFVEIAEDDFFGIVVESKDKQIIDRIFEELKKYQADELPPK